MSDAFAKHLFQSTWDKLSEDLRKYEKQYGTNINADKLSKMIKKATIELKENNEQRVAIKKEISTGLGKRRLMLTEMSGFDLSGNVQNIVCF